MASSYYWCGHYFAGVMMMMMMMTTTTTVIMMMMMMMMTMIVMLLVFRLERYYVLGVWRLLINICWKAKFSHRLAACRGVLHLSYALKAAALDCRSGVNMGRFHSTALHSRHRSRPQASASSLSCTAGRKLQLASPTLDAKEPREQK